MGSRSRGLHGTFAYGESPGMQTGVSAPPFASIGCQGHSNSGTVSSRTLQSHKPTAFLTKDLSKVYMSSEMPQLSEKCSESAKSRPCRCHLMALATARMFSTSTFGRPITRNKALLTSSQLNSYAYLRTHSVSRTTVIGINIWSFW